MHKKASYDLSLTTQGPSYPPSEVMDQEGNFIVIGRVNRRDQQGTVASPWARAIVSPSSPLPVFGVNSPYDIVRELPDPLTPSDAALILHTLPLPLPCNNYPMTFAPDQNPATNSLELPSYPFHRVPIPDMRVEDGCKIRQPITLGQWSRARGQLEIRVPSDRASAQFIFDFSGLIPNSLYTVMSLRQHDLNPLSPTRPGPLGIPNVLIADEAGSARYQATLPNPFPSKDAPRANRIVNVVLLWMSYQMNRGGAIGWYGLGGDVHAQLKLKEASFHEFLTVPC